MAASSGSGVRVRLNFDDSCRYVCESALYKSVWYLVNLDRQKTIEGLALEICSRFDISSNLRVALSLDGCLLPNWETTAILRDNDLVSVTAIQIGKKQKSSRSDWERSVTSENDRKNKKKRRAYEEGEENDLPPIVAAPKEKKRRNEVKNREIVEADVARCCSTDGSIEKKRNRQQPDTEILDLSDFPYDPNSVQSSNAVESRSCIVSSLEPLTHKSDRLQVEQTGTGVDRHKQTDRSSFVGGSTSSVGDESGFGKNVMVGNGIEEGSSQLNEDGLAADGVLGEVKNKAKRTRRSRKNRKEKNPALLEPELKSSNHSFRHTLELPSKDVQRRSFQWQKMDLQWSKSSAHSQPQHIVFDDGDDPDSRAADGKNIFIDGIRDGLPNHNMTGGVERVPGNKGEVPRADKGLSSYELKSSCHPVVDHEEQVLQLNKTTSRSSVAGSQLESASVGGGGYSCRLMTATSDSRDLSHEQKPRQTRLAADVSPFANVQVFKRQQRAKFQSPSTSAAESVLTSKGNQIQAPTCTKRQMPEDILDVTTPETTKDYSMYELLLGPPRPGDVIAYKILQLSADYSPVLSNYKEAMVLKFISGTRIVELEHKNMQIPSHVKKSTGRFDLTIEDDNEILTNSLKQDDNLISISWDLLLEPRLVA